MHHYQGRKFQSYAAYNDEYQSTLRNLALDMPDGVELPADASGGKDERFQYEVGYGASVAIFEWLHAIERAAVDADSAGNASQALHWTRVAEKVLDHGAYISSTLEEDRRAWHAHVIAPALAGDFRHMRAEVGPA